MCWDYHIDCEQGQQHWPCSVQGVRLNDLTTVKQRGHLSALARFVPRQLMGWTVWSFMFSLCSCCWYHRKWCQETTQQTTVGEDQKYCHWWPILLFVLTRSKNAVENCLLIRTSSYPLLGLGNAQHTAENCKAAPASDQQPVSTSIIFQRWQTGNQKFPVPDHPQQVGFCHRPPGFSHNWYTHKRGNHPCHVLQPDLQPCNRIDK